MRVLITGADGQVGRALLAAAPPEVETLALDRAGLDVTQEAQVAEVIRRSRPDLVMNAAGYTAVDRAEEETGAAYAVNAEGAGRLARAVGAIGARMVHFSTDYVFDGSQTRPYRPSDSPRPLNVYGASKLAGERAVLEALGDHAAVVRTAWVYASRGHNFLLTMLRLMRERERVRVVGDQVGTPTTAASVASATWAIASRPEVHGILHWTDEGSASWYDFAVAIRDEATLGGLVDGRVEVVPIPTSDYATPACRPRYGVLDCSDAREALGLTPDPWRVALRRTLGELAHG